MIPLKIDSKQRKVTGDIHPTGESEPITFEATYTIEINDKSAILKIAEINISKEWINNLVKMLPDSGKEFSLQPELSRLITRIRLSPDLKITKLSYVAHNYIGFPFRNAIDGFLA